MRTLIFLAGLFSIAACAPERDTPAPPPTAGGAGFYEPCEVHEDCASGLCTPRVDGGFCTLECDVSTDCPRRDELGGRPAFLCADQGHGRECLMQCLVHPEAPEAWPQGFGATCPDAWTCVWPQEVPREPQGRHQELCTRQGAD